MQPQRAGAAAMTRHYARYETAKKSSETSLGPPWGRLMSAHFANSYGSAVPTRRSDVPLKRTIH
jgi:hypothetical protein